MCVNFMEVEHVLMALCGSSPSPLQFQSNIQMAAHVPSNNIHSQLDIYTGINGTIMFWEKKIKKKICLTPKRCLIQY